MRIRTAGNECAVLASSDRHYLGCLDMHDGDIPLTDTRLAVSRCNGFDYSTGQAPIRPLSCTHKEALTAPGITGRSTSSSAWSVECLLFFITGRFFYRYHASKERP